MGFFWGFLTSFFINLIFRKVPVFQSFGFLRLLWEFVLNFDKLLMSSAFSLIFHAFYLVYNFSRFSSLTKNARKRGKVIDQSECEYMNTKLSIKKISILNWTWPEHSQFSCILRKLTVNSNLEFRFLYLHHNSAIFGLLWCIIHSESWKPAKFL